MSSDGPVRVKSFYNQEHARVAISELCARCVHDVLYMLDVATGPDGPDESGEPIDPETSKLYKEFRDWFAPNVGAAIQGLVVGPLLSRISFDSDGLVHIEDEVYSSYDDTRKQGNVSTMVARMKWIASEIPILVESYGQLYEEESSIALAMCDDVFSFNYDCGIDEVQQFVEECLPKLEMYHLHAQEGGRLLRGDIEAEQQFRESLDWSRNRIAELERDRVDALESESPSESQRVEIQYEINKLESRRKKMEQAVSSLDDKINILVEKLYD